MSMAGTDRSLLVSYYKVCQPETDPDRGRRSDVHLLLAAALQAPDRHIDNAADGLGGSQPACKTHLTIWSLPMSPCRDSPDWSCWNGFTRYAFTRVVVMTVASTPEDIIRALRGKLLTYLTKPFTIPAVSHMVRHGA
jgi:hypothetical protein